MAVFFFQAEDGIRDADVTGVQTCALPILDDAPSGKVIKAEVPLAEMFGYATDLRSATQGRATYSMEFARYSEIPGNVADRSEERRVGKECRSRCEQTH